VLAEALDDLVKSGSLSQFWERASGSTRSCWGGRGTVPGRVSVTIGHDEALAHQMQAGATYY